ncbi:MAG: CDP-alcohol phosphatidyltransferase family protein [Anaerolineae bacterium]
MKDSSITLTDWLRSRTAFLTTPVAQQLADWDVHPNAVTLTGGALVMGAAAVLALGHVTWGGILSLLTSSLDAVDGRLAAVSGRRSRFGAFLDSTVDRLSDGALFFGLLLHLLSVDAAVESALAFLALLGSLMVSYTRARAEGVGYECKVGWLTRVPRIVLLGVGLMVGLIRPTLVLLTVLSWFTVLQRVLHVYRQAQQDSYPNRSGRGGAA